MVKKQLFLPITSPFTSVYICQERSAAVSAAKSHVDDDPSPPSLVLPHIPLPSQAENQQQKQPEDSKQQADSKQPAAQEGYDVEVVNDTGAYDCRICFLIPRDPMQVSCCGKRFCRACIKRVLSEKNACPHCQTKGDIIKVFEDQGQRQAIMELKIYCPNRKQGCGWTGELCHLNSHVNCDSARDSREGCQYLELPCVHCSKWYPRHHMRSCPLQQYTCPYCKHYYASYSDVNSYHVLECDMILVSCSICGRKVARKNLHLHRTLCVHGKTSEGNVRNYCCVCSPVITVKSARLCIVSASKFWVHIWQ